MYTYRFLKRESCFKGLKTYKINVNRRKRVGFITRGYIMEHIENMHADLKLAKKNPG